MTYKLPRKVRRAVANITKCVDHKTVWVGDHSNQQKWMVTGGSDLFPLHDQEISVTSTDQGVKVQGLSFLEAELTRTGMETYHGLGYANEAEVIREILAVLEAAVAPSQKFEEYMPV